MLKTPQPANQYLFNKPRREKSKHYVPPDVRPREVHGKNFKTVPKSNLNLITLLDFIPGTRGPHYIIPSECNPQNPKHGRFYRTKNQILSKYNFFFKQRKKGTLLIGSNAGDMSTKFNV